MEKFESLPEEKRKSIIDAALQCFGTNGYRKTSMADIAAAAGISKAMVFHWFGTKNALYLYLAGLCSATIKREIDSHYDMGEHDFFHRIRSATAIKIRVMRQHPHMLAFLSSMYFETDPAVRPAIEATMETAEIQRQYFALDSLDLSRFKPGVDPLLVLRLLVRLGEGLVGRPQANGRMDIDAIEQEFDESLELLRQNLYRPEFLEGNATADRRQE